jgi:GNAT superfamily N-acetyltransferase
MFSTSLFRLPYSVSPAENTAPPQPHPQIHQCEIDPGGQGGAPRGALLSTASTARCPKERHTGRVYVTAAVRDTGIGRSIMNAALEHAARVEGIEQIGLLVATTQAAAMGLYQTFGFRSFGCEQRALKIGVRYVDEEHMVLYLKSGGE